MGIKKYKPTTPSRRFMTGLTYEELTTNEPYKPLTTYFKERAGRNNLGRLAVRHK
jgi:large subunit ribosomal protein L2